MADLEDRPTLLLVDDDVTFTQVLAEAFEARGYAVRVAHNVAAGELAAGVDSPEYAVVDLRMPGPSGLELVEKLKALDENTRIVVLTGYASVATAVEAIKLGAIQYFAKPIEVEAIVAVFDAPEEVEDTGEGEVPSDPLSVGRLEWEHIQRVLLEHEGNISATARALKMHRRTLQRKLAKRPLKA